MSYSVICARTIVKFHPLVETQLIIHYIIKKACVCSYKHSPLRLTQFYGWINCLLTSIRLTLRWWMLRIHIMEFPHNIYTSLEITLRGH